MTAALILSAMLFLAYSNGANDNFKGVATLFGSGASDYRRALLWATAATLAGSLCAIFLSGKLVAAFSGEGLVPDEIIASSPFIIAVGLGPRSPVFLGAKTGFPLSTTRALTGALAGVGIASGGGIQLAKLWGGFFLPLLISPFVALLLTVLVYPVFKLARRAMNVTRETCFCLDGREELVRVTPEGAAVLRSSGLILTVDQISRCTMTYRGSVAGAGAQTLLNGLHYLTAGAASFARGLNDTPKIIALIVSAGVLRPQSAVLLAGLAIAAGGLLNARKVARTMSKKITAMNHGQGFTANLVTAFLVVFASGWGMPVSTTHVSCGSLFGIGLVNGKADWRVVGKILLSWVLTLPIAGVLAAIVYKAV